MLESLVKRIMAQSLQAGLLGLSVITFPTLTWAAESLPADVRDCTAETDRDRRLACFDREIARFPDPRAAQTAKNQPAAAPAPAGAGQAAVPSANVAPAPATSTNGAPESTSAAMSATTTEVPSASKADSAARKPGHIAARVVSIDHVPNEMALHLDNGQVWQQVQPVAGDLSLKVGDSVTIDKRLGSYWLTGPHVSGMKVRQN